MMSLRGLVLSHSWVVNFTWMEAIGVGVPLKGGGGRREEEAPSSREQSCCFVRCVGSHRGDHS